VKHFTDQSSTSRIGYAWMTKYLSSAVWRRMQSRAGSTRRCRRKGFPAVRTSRDRTSRVARVDGFIAKNTLIAGGIAERARNHAEGREMQVALGGRRDVAIFSRQ